MKKMITLALLALMMACMPEPQHCELFGVSLGMSEDDALTALAKFGRVEKEGYGYKLTGVHSDGVKYDDAQFFISDGSLVSVHAHIKVEDLYPHPDTAPKVMRELSSTLARIDSALSLRHTVYNTIPVKTDFGDIVSTADKGRYADDRITVIWKPSDLPEVSHLSHTVSVILLPLEKNCKSTANQF